MRIVDFLLNLLGWFQIVIGITAVGFIVGAIVYYFNNSGGIVAGIILMSIGFVTGVIWATKIWIRTGTVDWLSRIRRIN